MYRQFSDIPAVVVLTGLETKTPFSLRPRQDRVQIETKTIKKWSKEQSQDQDRSRVLQHYWKNSLVMVIICDPVPQNQS